MKLRVKVISVALVLFLAAIIIACGGGGGSIGGGGQDAPSKEDLPSISVSLTSSTPSAKATNTTFTVSSSHSWSSMVSQDGNWCSLSPSSGAAGQTKVTLSVTENTTSIIRKAEITFSISGASAKTTVTQKAMDISQGGENMNPKNEDF